MKIKGNYSLRIKQMLCAFLMGMMMLWSVSRVHATEDYQVTELQMQGTVINTSTLNVRSGPGKDYKVIEMAEGGTQFPITGQTENGWYQVEIDGKTGYVSAKYVEAVEIQTQEAAETEPAEVGEPETGYHGLHQSPYVMKLAVSAVIIIIILIMIILTIKGMRSGDDEDEGDDGYEDEDDRYEDEEDDGYEDDEDEYEEEEDEDNEDVEVPIVKEKPMRREYILREEDYRIEIDPSFFEDKELIEQPPMATGYLERKKIEEEAQKAELAREAKHSTEAAADMSAEEIAKQKDLDQAMKKLDELQKEIERLKSR